IRTTDALIHVVRCFEEEEVIHVAGRVDPLADIETIELELILADMQMTDNTLEKLTRQARGDQTLLSTCKALEKVRTHLDQGHPLSTATLTPEERNLLAPYSFLTGKKVIYAANVAETDLQTLANNSHYQAVAALAKERAATAIPICARLEEELLQLDPEEATDYLTTLGLEEPGLNRLIRLGFQTLGLITFLTTGEQETRAWTISQGTNARSAAGKIHTDIERGFIRAEVIDYDDFIGFKGRLGAKEAGKVRLEGRDYTVTDGDVILFFHN
ncbi:MAG: redox-regulated ATPase YchF, partial [Chlamydiota bacterium]